MINHLKILRTLAVLEGISYLLLLGICVPVTPRGPTKSVAALRVERRVLAT